MTTKYCHIHISWTMFSSMTLPNQQMQFWHSRTKKQFDLVGTRNRCNIFCDAVSTPFVYWSNCTMCLRPSNFIYFSLQFFFVSSFSIQLKCFKIFSRAFEMTNIVLFIVIMNANYEYFLILFFFDNDSLGDSRQCQWPWSLSFCRWQERVCINLRQL